MCEVLCGTINPSMRFRRERIKQRGPTAALSQWSIDHETHNTERGRYSGRAFGWPELGLRANRYDDGIYQSACRPRVRLPCGGSHSRRCPGHGARLRSRLSLVRYKLADARGWVAGNELAYFYQQRYVPVVEYGPRIGLPIVVFSFDTYWDRYYRGRPFYGERTRWRTVWRDRDGGGRRDADRSRDRREGRADRQTIDRRQGDVDRRREGKVQSDRRQGEADRRQSDRRREVDRRQGDSSEKGVNCPANRQTDRTESRERSEGRALSSWRQSRTCQRWTWTL